MHLGSISAYNLHQILHTSRITIQSLFINRSQILDVHFVENFHLLFNIDLHLFKSICSFICMIWITIFLIPFKFNAISTTLLFSWIRFPVNILKKSMNMVIGFSVPAPLNMARADRFKLIPVLLDIQNQTLFLTLQWIIRERSFTLTQPVVPFEFRW